MLEKAHHCLAEKNVKHERFYSNEEFRQCHDNIITFWIGEFEKCAIGNDRKNSCYQVSFLLF